MGLTYCMSADVVSSTPPPPPRVFCESVCVALGYTEKLLRKTGNDLTWHKVIIIRYSVGYCLGVLSHQDCLNKTQQATQWVLFPSLFYNTELSHTQNGMQLGGKKVQRAFRTEDCNHPTNGSSVALSSPHQMIGFSSLFNCFLEIRWGTKWLEEG